MYVFPRTYMLSVFYMNLLVVYVLELKQTSAVQFASTRGTAITLFIFKYVLVGQHHFRYVCYSSKALPAAHSHTSSTLSSWTKKVRRLKADRLLLVLTCCSAERRFGFVKLETNCNLVFLLKVGLLYAWGVVWEPMVYSVVLWIAGGVETPVQGTMQFVMLSLKADMKTAAGIFHLQSADL